MPDKSTHGAGASFVTWRFGEGDDAGVLGFDGTVVVTVLGRGLDLATTFAAAQAPQDGTWPGRVRTKYFEPSWPGGIFGPSEVRTNSGEAVLWFLGRMRVAGMQKAFFSC